jgi:hypothetical protein
MRCLAPILWLAAISAPLSLAAAERPRISFELLTKPGVPLTASQQWYKVLSEAGVSGLQIHTAPPRPEMGITELGTKSSPSYKVVGILSADNVLYVPGAKFTLQDAARLRKYLDHLGDDGAEGVTEPRSAFGFTPRQLQEVNDAVRTSIDFETKSLPLAQAVDRIARALKTPLEIDDAARRRMVDLTVEDELRGMSAGTALAAIVRPAGLALMPERTGGQLRLRIGLAQAGREAWPIGWPSKEEKTKLLPEMFERLNVEMSDITVSDAAAAIHERLKVPFLYDRNAMAAEGVDPTQVEARVPPKKMSYSQALGKVLLAARLQFELRVDEADKPFVWITAVKRAR